MTSLSESGNEPPGSLKTISKTSWYHNNVHPLDWLAQNPDLNPIEHLWNELDRRLRSREIRPISIVQLSAMLQEEWRRIPVDILYKLVESMPDRTKSDRTGSAVLRMPVLSRSPAVCDFAPSGRHSRLAAGNELVQRRSAVQKRELWPRNNTARSAWSANHGPRLISLPKLLLPLTYTPTHDLLQSYQHPLYHTTWTLSHINGQDAIDTSREYEELVAEIKE
ncbi:hypothetical protein ANN_06393 [Periplaneta americana]|uniref:Uncharacterized protein n=1 Tax=Periplaneta americana TaxID=6978 RepID=A0ABQ8TDE5_PERAM|nr:hypothetical protein ANN_06393 [Periplaneta americana]